jgi:IrrE N-terminal-like domain
VPSVVAELRRLCPDRPLTIGDSLRIAERQASALLRSADVAGPPVPSSAITDLPRLQVERLVRIPVSGSAHWAQGRWVIVLNRLEPAVRQRFSLCHEFKHVLDAPFGDRLYPAWRGLSGNERSEQIADHFAASLLMPKAWVKRAFFNQGLMEVPGLARRFDVSQAAMRVRLCSLGIVDGNARCDVGRAA